MFVKSSKYDKLLIEKQLLELEFNNRTNEWNKLVKLINSKGGENFLNNATLTTKVVTQFTDSELRSLLQLVHPDKHDGKTSAVTLTQKINQLRTNQ